MRSILVGHRRSVIVASLLLVATTLLGCSSQSKLEGNWVTDDGIHRATFGENGWFRQNTMDSSRPVQVNVQSKYLVVDQTTLKMTGQDGSTSIYEMVWEGDDHLTLIVNSMPQLILLRDGSTAAVEAVRLAEAEAVKAKTPSDPNDIWSRIEAYYSSLKEHNYLMASANAPGVEAVNEWDGDFGSVRQADYSMQSWKKQKIWSEDAVSAYALYRVTDSQGNSYLDKWTYRFEPWRGWKPIARDDAGQESTVSENEAPPLTDDQLNDLPLPPGMPPLAPNP